MHVSAKGIEQNLFTPTQFYFLFLFTCQLVALGTSLTSAHFFSFSIQPFFPPSLLKKTKAHALALEITLQSPQVFVLTLFYIIACVTELPSAYGKINCLHSLHFLA